MRRLNKLLKSGINHKKFKFYTNIPKYRNVKTVSLRNVKLKKQW